MSDSETEGKILRALNELRGDVQSLREHSDARHRTVANELAELRAMAVRAVDVAADAKRIADSSSHEMRGTQQALMKHTEGLAARQKTIEVENAKQTESLEALLSAEKERKIREDARKEQDEERWKWIGRVWPIATAFVGIAAYVLGHWKP